MEKKRLMSRLIAALIIALVGLFIYFSQTQKNPITGAKQHVSLSADQEIRLGIESAPEMVNQMGGEIPKTDPRALVVEKVGKRLVSVPIAEKSPWRFEFHLLRDSDTVNAFALPGGQIFITLGLLQQLQNEADLAGVLGHEIGHVFERHTAEQMAKNQLGQSMVIAVGTAASDQVPSAYIIAAFVNQMVQLKYSREDEQESDQWGIRLLEESNYNPIAMINVMEVLKKASNSAGLDIFASHPNPDKRIKDIKAYLLKNPMPPNVSFGYSLNDLYQDPSLLERTKFRKY